MADDGRVYISKSVVFNERVFPFALKSTAASSSSPSLYQSAPIHVLVQPAATQSTQCNHSSQSPASISVRNTSTDATAHVEEQPPSTAAATPVEEQPPFADDASLLPSEEQSFLAGTDSVPQDMHPSPALSTEAIVTPMSGGPALVASTDQQAAAESFEQPSDSVDDLQVDHVVDAVVMPVITQPLYTVALPEYKALINNTDQGCLFPGFV
ncbi:hypothetical protein V6N12_006824 [Hibiscus sabdariffa]|uniref:Uncharacterized protein n=1 Tax=Hibiscus sabdariffa TaxID=183260 RepID=A0ABR2EZY7_9ROSI